MLPIVHGIKKMIYVSLLQNIIQSSTRPYILVLLTRQLAEFNLNLSGESMKWVHKLNNYLGNIISSRSSVLFNERERVQYYFSKQDLFCLSIPL